MSEIDQEARAAGESIACELDYWADEERTHGDVGLRLSAAITAAYAPRIAQYEERIASLENENAAIGAEKDRLRMSVITRTRERDEANAKLKAHEFLEKEALECRDDAMRERDEARKAAEIRLKMLRFWINAERRSPPSRRHSERTDGMSESGISPGNAPMLHAEIARLPRLHAEIARLRAENASLCTIIDAAHTIELNMNDTFAYACAGSEEMDACHVDKMLPIVSEYGSVALTAYAAVKGDREPIEQLRTDADTYAAAKAAVEAAFPDLKGESGGGYAEELEDEIALLRSALEHYSERNNWIRLAFDEWKYDGPSSVEDQPWAVAQQALKPQQEETS